MKKASKILTLILVAVIVLSVFAGCDLVGRNVKLYRGTVAMTVGDQEITIGKLLDTFNSYYNNYSYYVNAGYLTGDDLLEMALNSLLQQYIQLDDYVSHHRVVTQSLQNPKVPNAEFLRADQFEYCIKYVKHSSFTTFDETVITNLSVKHDIGDATDEDTSRDFTEWDTLFSETSYADHKLNSNFDSKEADEYFDKYYGEGVVDFADLDKIVSDYVYTEETEATRAIIDELNDRLEDESDEITYDEYVSAQQKVLDQYRDTVKNNYGLTLDEFMVSQVADMVTSCILAMWSHGQYKSIDVASKVNEANITKADAQDAEFKINENFDSFITSLTDSSFIYSVPQAMQGKYVFVKNILVPFTNEQSTLLSAQSDSYGANSDAYKNFRNELAEKIVAEYFYSDNYENKAFDELFELVENDDEDADTKYEKLADLFVINADGEISINSEGALGKFFVDGKVVVPSEWDNTKTPDDVVVELMRRFNTDTAQHKSRYDYVVYVGDDWETYSHSWVEEFYTAVNKLDRNSDGSFAASNKGKYAMCVSTYGVHIIYVEGFVEDYVYNYKGINWADASSWNDTSSLNYVRYKAEFDNQVNIVTQEAFDALEKTYLETNKVTINKQFKRFLKHNDFNFNFDEFIKEVLEEL